VAMAAAVAIAVHSAGRKVAAAASQGRADSQEAVSHHRKHLRRRGAVSRPLGCPEFRHQIMKSSTDTLHLI
jgi:hypothetical protein